MKQKQRAYHCPVCKTRIAEPKALSCFPFCSDRCKLFDLGDWLTEKHRISTPVSSNDDGDELPTVPGNSQGGTGE